MEMKTIIDKLLEIKNNDSDFDFILNLDNNQCTNIFYLTRICDHLEYNLAIDYFKGKFNIIIKSGDEILFENPSNLIISEVILLHIDYEPIFELNIDLLEKSIWNLISPII